MLFAIYARRQRKHLGDTEGVRMRTANRMARKYLSEANEISTILKSFMWLWNVRCTTTSKPNSKWKRRTLAKKKLKTSCLKSGWKKPLVNDFVSVLENCEFARYTPSSVKAMEQDYANTAKMITQIDKQL